MFKFSIIIPSYNEEEDIRLSVESAALQDWPAKEILVVDDSTDRTPEIIKEYESKGVRYIRGNSAGCCEARNKGMREASGDIVVLLNADVILPRDFLRKIAAHYESGAGYVLVESRVFNTDSLWARFIQAQHTYDHKKILRDNAEWTEGFSCRRDAALAVGLIPGDFSVRFCRDWTLGRRLRDAGYKKVIDRNIVVTDKAPGSFGEFWEVRKARGRFGSLAQYFLWRRPLLFLIPKFAAKHVILALQFLLLLPALLHASALAKYSHRLIKDILPFFGVYFLQECARAKGEWDGVKMILSKR